jgi:hypothetical protein
MPRATGKSERPIEPPAREREEAATAVKIHASGGRGPAGNGTIPGPGIGGIEFGVGDAVPGHGRRSRGYHRHHHPEPGGEPGEGAPRPGREQDPGEGEGQGEHGVGKADHVPEDENPVPDSPDRSRRGVVHEPGGGAAAFQMS